MLLGSCFCSIMVFLVFGFIGRGIGQGKTVGPVGGFLIGGFGGLLGLIILMFLPDKTFRRPRRHRRPVGPPRRGGAYPQPEPLGEPEPVFEMRFSCPKCSKKFSIQDPGRAGTKAKCSDCQTVFLIPEPPA
jgi:predicted Zn finger-like uncharacterized protein